MILSALTLVEFSGELWGVLSKASALGTLKAQKLGPTPCDCHAFKSAQRLKWWTDLGILLGSFFEGSSSKLWINSFVPRMRSRCYCHPRSSSCPSIFFWWYSSPSTNTYERAYAAVRSGNIRTDVILKLRQLNLRLQLEGKHDQLRPQLWHLTSRILIAGHSLVGDYCFIDCCSFYPLHRQKRLF